MNNSKHINIDQFDYELPDEKIAKFPLDKRDHSRLLIYNKGIINESRFYNLTDYLPKGYHLIFNNTHVIQSRLIFQKTTGAEIEIFCLEPYKPSDYALNFQEKGKCQWKCIIGNLKKWKNDSLIKDILVKGKPVRLSAHKVFSAQSKMIIEFQWNNNISFIEVLEASGSTPIPPYLKRESESIDKERYQTIYGKVDGSVAAPTAGLHFTDTIISKIKKESIDISELTLHVGAGTFKPVKSDTIGEHEMHTEHYTINIDLIDKIISNQNIIATGTTTLRTLESIYWAGIKCIQKQSPLHIEQWYPYKKNVEISLEDSLNALKAYMKKNNKSSFLATTQILIVPGYKFKVIKGLITNYHQPRSTLLLLVAAFIGNNWKMVYDFALKNDFRFLSYGDSSLLLP